MLRFKPLQDLDDLRHVRAERGKRLLDALLIADVRVDLIEDAISDPTDVGCAVRLNISTSSPTVRKATSSRRVRSGDDQRVEVPADQMSIGTTSPVSSGCAHGSAECAARRDPRLRGVDLEASPAFAR